MPTVLAWFLTFNFINIAWVFFRAKDFNDAWKVLKGMLGFEGIMLPERWANISFFKMIGANFGTLQFYSTHDRAIIVLGVISLFIVLFARNSMELVHRFKPSLKCSLFIALIFVVSMIYSIYSPNNKEFIYYQF